MTPRRQYGSGSISQRHDHPTCPPVGPDGVRPKHDCQGTWVGRISSGIGWTATGGRRVLVVSAKTEAKCKARLRARQNEIGKKGVEAARPRTLTVKAWTDTWLALQQRAVRPSTYATDRSTVRQWIVPTIGTKRLDALTPGDIRAVVSAVRDAGRKPSTVLRCHVTLRNLLVTARREGHTIPDSVLTVKAPSKGSATRGAITPDDTLAILDVAASRPDGVRWAVSILQGLRPGEVLGLRWVDVDFDRGLIDVRWQLDTLPYLDPKDKAAGFRVPDDFETIHLKGGYHLTPTKTAAGQRVIPLLPWMRDALIAWQAVAPPNPWGLVFASTDTRYGDERPTPTSEPRARDAWRAILAEANVNTDRPYDLYEARHTAATLLLEAGVDPHVVVQIMGHTSIDTTRIYQHATIAKRREALEKIADRVRPQIEG